MSIIFIILLSSAVVRMSSTQTASFTKEVFLLGFTVLLIMFPSRFLNPWSIFMSGFAKFQISHYHNDWCLFWRESTWDTSRRLQNSSFARRALFFLQMRCCCNYITEPKVMPRPHLHYRSCPVSYFILRTKARPVCVLSISSSNSSSIYSNQSS